jgi:hypothetical protein
VAFERPGRPRDEGRLISAADLAGLGIGLLAADGFLPAPIREACGALGIAVVPPVFDPGACLAASAGLPEIDPAALLPMYAREPEAVVKWRKLHPR